MSPGRPFSTDAVVIGENPRMRAIYEYVRLIAGGDSTVLIRGESGSGKEVIANLLHHQSGRRLQPFVAVSCAVLSETLIESELFGHERGAFTGAVKERSGRFELADGGTIFLDDIDDVPVSLQVKLLRVLQDHTIERVGGARAIPIDVRIIAGSKRNLGRLVSEGRFREDLYYRLNVLPINLPPLRDRRDDIPVLTDHFFARFFGKRGRPVPPISPVVRRAFQHYSWPGNVRELENTCERIAQTSVCDRVRAGCLAAGMAFEASAAVGPVAARGAAMAAAATPHEPPAGQPQGLDERLRRFERAVIAKALGETGGNKSKAAALLGVKRSTLGDRIVRCGLDGSGLHEETGTGSTNS
jgi:transcriptional regulator with GAF, ATPase, and Fis domain